MKRFTFIRTGIRISSYTGSKKLRLWIPVTLLLVTGLSFYPSLANDFQQSWDDQWTLLENPMLFYPTWEEIGQRYVSTDFRLFDREVADVIRQLPEQNPYIRNVFAWLSPKKEGLFQHRTENVQSIFRSTTIPYRLGLRQYGDTKYTVWQLVRLGIRGLTNGSIRPLRIGIMTGAAVFMISLILTGFLIIHHWVMGTPWTGWEMVLTGGMFLGSIQLMMLCLIGEYTGKIFLQSLGRPSYIIRDPIERNVNERAKEMKYKA